MRRVLPLLVALGLVPLLTSPATAAAPERIAIGDVVLDQEQSIRLYPSLCSETPAGDISKRPSVPVTVVWTVVNDGQPEEDQWHGNFYPRHESQPAAIDIPDWVTYGTGTERRCDRREVSPDALTILEAAGVAVASGDLEPGASLRGPWVIVVGLVVVGVVGVVLQLWRRASRRMTNEPKASRPGRL